MGNEIKRDVCPEKYYAKGSVIKDSIPTIIALVIVAFFSGNMFYESGMETVVTIIIEAVFVCGMYGFVLFMFKGMKKRIAATYISVCENGVCGVCQMNGFKNKTFELSYAEITKMVVRGERLFLSSKKEKVSLTLKDAAATAELIRSKNPNL